MLDGLGAGSQGLPGGGGGREGVTVGGVAAGVGMKREGQATPCCADVGKHGRITQVGPENAQGVEGATLPTAPPADGRLVLGGLGCGRVVAAGGCASGHTALGLDGVHVYEPGVVRVVGQDGGLRVGRCGQVGVEVLSKGHVRGVGPGCRNVQRRSRNALHGGHHEHTH